MHNRDQVPILHECPTGNWCVVHVRHQHEKGVTEFLSRQGFRVFFPTYDAVRQWSDRKKRITLPLFPGYLFLVDEAQRRLQVLSAPGVHTILTIGKVPAVIPHEEVAAIRRAVESSLPVGPHPFLKTGEIVRIKSGPLAGLEGIVSREKDVFRVVLSVELLGRSAAVEIDVAAIERLCQPGEPILGNGAIFPAHDRLNPTSNSSQGYVS